MRWKTPKRSKIQIALKPEGHSCVLRNLAHGHFSWTLDVQKILLCSASKKGAISSPGCWLQSSVNIAIKASYIIQTKQLCFIIWSLAPPLNVSTASPPLVFKVTECGRSADRRSHISISSLALWNICKLFAFFVYKFLINF